jgi:hypothetical protein
MAIGEKTGGRKKGTPNAITTNVKHMVLEALETVGGAEYLVAQSATNPTAFMTLVGKVLPMTVAGDPDAPLVEKVLVEIVRADSKDTDS